jgi:putative hydrolase of the HAD superfamily
MRRGATIEIFYRILATQGHEVEYEEFREAYLVVTNRQNEIANVNWEEFDHKERLGNTLKTIGFQHDDFNEVVSKLWETYLLEWPRDSVTYEETMPLLEFLKDRYKLGLVTNFVDGLTARKAIGKYRFDEIFDVIVISGEEGYRKPKRTLFDKALSELKSLPEYSVMIGDTLIADVVGPKEIGMKAILVDEYGDKKESYHLADAVVGNIGEVKTIITTWS